MGCAGSAPLVAQPRQGAYIITRAVSHDGPLVLTLGPDDPQGKKLTAPFIDEADGTTVVTFSRSAHIGNSMTLLPQTVSITDGSGNMVGILANGSCEPPNGPKNPVTGATMIMYDAQGRPRQFSYRNGEGVGVLFLADPPDGAEDGCATMTADNGKTLYAAGEIKPTCSAAQAERKGIPNRYLDGVGFFPASRGGFAAEPQLTMQLGGAVVNKLGERVATCREAFDSSAGSKKVTVAQGCDAVLVLALSSEWDANRRAKSVGVGSSATGPIRSP